MAERPPSLDPATPSNNPQRELKVENLVAKPIGTKQLPNDRRGLSIARRVLALFPVALALLMYFVTPVYFRPMLDTPVGLVLLGIVVATVCVGYGLVEAGSWLYRKGRVVFAILVFVGYSITWIVAVSIVLLGPAALILMAPRA
jgi:hypothetical protein